MSIVIVSATRFPEVDFWSQSALGVSLARMGFDTRLVAAISFNNTDGLPAVYNRSAQLLQDEDLVVFIHDDVWLDDFCFAQRVVDGLAQFDVIGVVGNTRRSPNQPGWAFLDFNETWEDFSYLSGGVAHGQLPFANIGFYGTAPRECELLDGVLLATSARTLRQNQLHFDEAFTFDLYDLDFCRSARAKNLRLGTWPIAITHQSTGADGYQSARWRAAAEQYLAKWQS